MMNSALRFGCLLCMLAVAGGLGSCSDGPSPTWIRLAKGFRPRSLLSNTERMHQAWQRSLPDGPTLFVKPTDDGGSVWIEYILADDGWSPGGVAGLWKAPKVIYSAGGTPDTSQRMQVDGEELTFVFEPSLVVADAVQSGSVTPGTFFEWRNEIYVANGKDAPPHDSRHSVYLECGREVADHWRVRQSRFAGEGLSIWPGMREQIPIDLLGETTLRFATVSQRRVVWLEDPAPVSFRISLNGRSLFEHSQAVAPGGALAWHAVDLPADAQGTLVFEVDGPPSLTAFLQPVIGPSDAERRVAPRAADARPDIIVFLADTFRADNMRLYGGEQGVTPHLDAFAEECLRFHNSWSPAPWTLPAHASMFSGIFPLQHYATSKTLALTDEVVTLAEVLSEAGYRTGAITDSMIVSHRNGLDQGFQWWDERQRDFADTLQRVTSFLEQDDGRPVFLFVQTYKVHEPYTVSAETRRMWPGRFGGSYAEVKSAMRAELTKHEPGGATSPELEAAMARYRDAYLGGVVDLDRGFGEFLQVLEDLGLDQAYLVFTSDHGESFFEHGQVGHGKGVWEEEVRIPMLIRGPGLAPRDVQVTASLVDLPATVADMAGIEVDPSWLGSSLLGLNRDRPLFSFLARSATCTLGILEGTRKLIAVADVPRQRVTSVTEVYDLAADPGELVNLVDQDLAWAHELAERLRPIAELLLKPLKDPQSGRMSADHLDQLRAIGYVDY